MARIAAFLALGVAAGATAAPASAQSFDCTKARPRIESAICASPALMEQDKALAQAYAEQLAREPAKAAALRTEQRAWLAERERLCTTRNANPARLAACLAGIYRARLAVLKPAAGPTPPARAGTAEPPAAAAAVPVAAGAILAGPPRPAAPDLPARLAEPEGSLSKASVPASGSSDALVDIRVPGRFAIRAESGSGVSLQLVDMIAGPGDVSGEAGAKDGRIDALLDRGAYKLRIVGRAGAAGEAKLTIAPFREAAEIGGALAFGGEAATELADLAQRSFWVAVEKPGRVSVEATGRSLADLRLWRNGIDLSELAPRIDSVAPKAGRPMARARIEGQVEPGLYLATAYGGPKAAWADGDAGQPLFVRTGPPEPMLGNWLDGVIGASGSARFEAPAAASQFRLELPEPAPARLTVTRAGSSRTASVAKNSREPVAILSSSGGDQKPVIEVTGQDGQPFRLRALDPSASRRIATAGLHYVAVDVAGEGGDEFPATVLLAQFEAGKGARVVASNAPQIGPGKAWRRKLNFRGASSLVFEVTAAMPVAVGVTGLKLTATIGPLIGARPPRTDGKTPRWDLEPGWYRLSLAPVEGAFGIVDLTIGPPGLTGEMPKTQPARASVPLGIQTFERGGNYQFFTNEAPGLVLAPVARPLPANLETAPLAVFQEAGQALDVAIRAPARGYLAATGVDGVPVAVARTPEATTATGRTQTLRLPAPDRPRSTVLSWSDPARPPAPPLDAAARAEPVAAGRPAHFDLAAGGSKSFSLEVPEGGLYRVETLGRLRTSVAVATSFLPGLDKAEANGAGQNALAQTYLRAGRYAVVVKASDSAGRLGLVARRAELVEGGALTPETSARATLADGRGAAFPIEIAEAGTHKLELFSLGEPLRARLEDAEGWPLTVPGPTTAIERRFEAGRYRLVVLPGPVDARAVVRLTRAETPPALAGHGPHPLVADAERRFQWREPTGSGDPRTPDRWQFALAAPADVTLALSDGMVGDLLRVGEAAPVARVVGKTDHKSRLPAGRYAVEARSLGRNDRLDYRISLKTREIQPGVPRIVQLPATVPLALAEDRVVSLTSFGRTDLRGVLKDDGGRVVERLDDRAGDWNIALSRMLPAGAYTLELSEVEGGPAKADADAAASDEGEPDAEEASDESEGEDDGDAPDNASTSASEDGVEIRFDLPEAKNHPALDMAAEAKAAGGEVHRFDLPLVERHHLVIAAARSASELVLSVERRDGEGRWAAVGAARGGAPLVALSSDGDAARPLRLSVWAVDGGPAAIQLAARHVKREPGGTGRMALDAVPFGAVASDIRADLVAAPASGLLAVSGRVGELLAGSVAGRALQPVEGGLIVPQSDAVWLVARGTAETPLVVEPAPPPASSMAVTVPEDGRATWPRAASPAGTVRLYRADSTFGQPGLGAGRGMGVAPGSAVALEGDDALRAWNAGGGDPLAIRVGAHDLTLRPEIRTEAEHGVSLPPGTAGRVRLPAGRKRLTLDLGAGTAAILGHDARDATTIWTGADAVSRTLEGEWTSILLANPGAEPRPVRVSLAPPSGEAAGLSAGGVAKRFFGAAGSLAFRTDAARGDRLVVAGADATFAGDDGRVMRGRSLALTGPGEIVLDHGVGLVAAWIERPGLSPWPDAPARSVALPATAKLEGAAMALTLKPATPILLHARTTAPVILSAAQGGAAAEPVAFPAGAAFHRLLAPGEAILRLYSPHDGPLAGSLELTASPIVPAGEGTGEAVALAPGATVLFGFEVARRSTIGVGVRAEPDIVAVRLLDASGKSFGAGIAQLHTLERGRYILEASVPAGGKTTAVRPAIVGIAPPPSGPPPDVVREYLQMVGLAPTAPGR